MKNVAIINACNYGSTGKIGMNLNANLINRGYSSTFYYALGDKSNKDVEMKYQSYLEFCIHYGLAKITDKRGAYSRFATYKLLRRLKKTAVDTIFILNTHDFCICEDMLYKYVQKNNVNLINLLIDNTPYTPRNEFDRKQKLKHYQDTKNLLFLSPQYGIDSAKKTEFAPYMNMVVLDEAIDLSFYKPQDASDLRKKHNIDTNQKIILCVAPMHNESKGARYFLELAKRFENNKDYVFIHIGNREPKSQNWPDNYIPIGFVKEDSDVAKYYSLADLFVFPSLLDMMSNTCIEALSCGTPLLVFNISGMPYLLDKTVGEIVEAGNVDAMCDVVSAMKPKNAETIDICRKYAESRYDNKKYVQRIEEILSSNFG